MDFFPTLLDLLDLYDQSWSVLQGISALDAHRPQSAVLANNNGAKDPFDFALFNGADKLRFLLDEKDPLRSLKIPVTGGICQQGPPDFFAREDGDPFAVFVHRYFSRSLQDISFLTFHNSH
jgi:hypothetical protein